MIDVLGLEERGFNAWPAPRNIYFGGWMFRLGGGYTKRANSANALGGRQEMRAEFDQRLDARARFVRGDARGRAFLRRQRPADDLPPDPAGGTRRRAGAGGGGL